MIWACIVTLTSTSVAQLILSSASLSVAALGFGNLYPDSCIDADLLVGMQISAFHSLVGHNQAAVVVTLSSQASWVLGTLLSCNSCKQLHSHSALLGSWRSDYTLEAVSDGSTAMIKPLKNDFSFL